jgi:Glyoxalase/Bleomycin resistance protein/Dioxygenase superfamily
MPAEAGIQGPDGPGLSLRCTGNGAVLPWQGPLLAAQLGPGLRRDDKFDPLLISKFHRLTAIASPKSAQLLLTARSNSAPCQSRSSPQLYHFAFEAGSPAGLAEKRDELRAKGVETTDIVDHGWAQSIYFKDPNSLSLEYCRIVRHLTKDDATIRSSRKQSEESWR